ncbi:WD domain, G-beta repeat protein [Ostertagia ostertagi]
MLAETMDLLKGYVQSDEELSDDDPAQPISLNNCKSLAIPGELTVAPEVATKSILKQIAIVDPRTKELKTNPRYEQLFQPEAGPSNPFKSENQKAQKNVLTGFRRGGSYQRLSLHSRASQIEAAIENQGESLFESKKTGGEKRKRQANFDPSDIEGYTGPWAKYCDEKTIAKPDPELQKEMDEITRKRQANSRRFKRKQQQQQGDNAEESSVLHLKEAQDYQGRSFLVPPAFTGVNLRADAAPEKCFIPKKQIHVYKGHTKGVNCLQWFPKSAHLFLSCSMDTKIKLWEVYGKHQVVRTYSGHKLPVREVAFNNEGTEFLSASFDRYIKLWDTGNRPGELVKQRFHTGHIPFCVKFHPDDDKNHMFLSGMQNKKIVQWDTRTGEIVQEYDRHLGAVNSITFFDKNRRFASTSDDKSIRIWEWEIPLRFAKKKAFRGHNSAGYACVTDFSPDMSYLISGDADGKLFIWDWRTHKIVARWKAHDNTCISARWHPKEKSKILTAGWDNGRPIHVTSRIQLEYKQDQLRLAKKIVALLSEVNEMEAAHKQAESRRIQEAQEIDAHRPKSKGTRSIA